ncbi:hypothetical protein SUGI_0855610 [Cryptomeria japonica]|nr:hypothetical protein SUGI_0855610 [Cryptomeria japonica]
MVEHLRKKGFKKGRSGRFKQTNIPKADMVDNWRSKNVGKIFKTDVSSPNGVGDIGAGATLPPGVEINGGKGLRGPFMLDGIGVHLIDWQLDFNPRTHKLPECPIWVRLYNIPSEYWNTKALKEIGNYFGSFISADEIMEDRI